MSAEFIGERAAGGEAAVEPTASERYFEALGFGALRGENITAKGTTVPASNFLDFCPPVAGIFREFEGFDAEDPRRALVVNALRMATMGFLDERQRALVNQEIAT
jgi:hypothetical protein